MSSSLIKVRDVSHVIYEHPDLDKMEAFLLDFGLARCTRTDDALYMRGTSGAHHIYVARRGATSRFVGLAFTAAARSDLETLTSYPGATAIEALAGPGGGECVSITDPNGFRIDVVHGIEEAPELELKAPLVLNNATAKHRLGTPQRLAKEPPQVVRLGHVGINVISFKDSFRFYSSVLGMLPSDRLYDGEPGNFVGGFLRCNRDDEWSDHHSLAVFESPKGPSIHHASFEMQDIDSVMYGHEWLTSRGWTQYWGVGRHYLGSQVFDYWRDPFGNMIEHYADGDVCNASTEGGTYQRSPDLRRMWGPAVPSNFME